MLNRFAALAACSLIPLGPRRSHRPTRRTDDPGPPPDNGVVASAEPGIVTSPDGWVLTVVAKDETQLPVAPLTTAVSSREYLVGGTFTGTVTGGGKTSLSGGVLEAGYQIGCGIELGQVRLIGQAGVSVWAATPAWPLSTSSSVPLSGTIEIHPKPGTVSTVTVDKKTFKAAPVRVTLKDTHIKVDGCVGPVLHPVVCDADEFDDRHRRRRRLLRRDQSRLTSRAWTRHEREMAAARNRHAAAGLSRRSGGRIRRRPPLLTLRRLSRCRFPWIPRPPPPPPQPGVGVQVPLMGAPLGPAGFNVLAQNGQEAVPGALGAPAVVGLDQNSILGQNAIPSAPGGGPGVVPNLNVFNNAYGIQQYEKPSAPGHGEQFDVAPGDENADVSRREWLGRYVDMYRAGMLKGGLLGQMPKQQLGESLPGTAPPPGTNIPPGLVEFQPDPAAPPDGAPVPPPAPGAPPLLPPPPG